MEKAKAQLPGAYTTFMESLQVEKQASPHTLDAYGRDLQDFFAFAGLDTDPIAAELVLAADRQLRSYIGSLLKQGFARRSINRRLSALRSFFKFLLKTRQIDRLPRSLGHGPRITRRLPNCLTTQSVLALLQAPPGDTPLGLRDRALLELLYASGIRLAELIGLNTDSVELPPDSGTGWVRVIGKGDRERRVPIGSFAVAALNDYLRSGRPHLLRNSNHQEVDDTALFLSYRGGRLSRRGVAYILRKYAGQVAPGQKVTPHTLRHTFATHLLSGGADLRAVQELLGHQQVTTTQIYTHVTQEHVRRNYFGAHPRA